MNNWLTTHYPHPQPDTHPWHIYIQDKHKQVATNVKVHDRVFFYEFKTHKPIKNEPIHPIGLQGIVRIASVSGPIYLRNDEIEYIDGTKASYLFGIPATTPNVNGFVSRVELCRILNFKLTYQLRGFAGGTGLMRLSDEDASQLFTAFSKGTKR